MTLVVRPFLGSIGTGGEGWFMVRPVTREEGSRSERTGV